MIWVCEYSPKQKSFHVDTLERVLEVNRQTATQGLTPGYVPIYMTTTSADAHAFAEKWSTQFNVTRRQKSMNSEIKKCPICDGGLIHPVGVYVRIVGPDGPVVHTITAQGYEARDPFFEDIGSTRGVVIVREFLGECGHRWIEKEQFHKGSTFQDRQQLDPLVGPYRVIWRD